MGLNTLSNRSNGQTILDTFFNDIHTAINGDFVGRDTNGVPTSAQNLGTTAFPWGTIRGSSLILGGAVIDTSQITAEVNRVVSGKKRSSSNQPQFLTPNGAAASFILDGTPINLVVDINGSAVTVTTDITKSSLTVAPSTNNTALVNDSTAADQADTRLWGEPEHRKTITIDTVGSEISSRVGQFCAFKLDNGSATEFFYALIESATILSNARRGYFYDSALAPKNRIFFSDNDTITLMSHGWVFIENNATTVDVSYTVPVWSVTAPTSPATGDYWYDQLNSVWKRYDGASFQIINRTLIGSVVLDSTNCVAARCRDFYKAYAPENTLSLEISSTSVVKAKKIGSTVNVSGTAIKFYDSKPTWNITTHLASSSDMYNATEQASTMYYLYLKDDYSPVISDIQPYFRSDLYGMYHPHNPWRCIGLAFNDASSNITNTTGVDDNFYSEHFNKTNTGQGSTNTAIRITGTNIRNFGADFIYATSATLGDSYTVFMPGRYFMTRSDNDTGTANSFHGFSLNSNQLTTAIDLITEAHKLDVAASGNADNHANKSVTTADCLIGDVIRPHGATTQNNALASIKVMRMS